MILNKTTKTSPDEGHQDQTHAQCRVDPAQGPARAPVLAQEAQTARMIKTTPMMTAVSVATGEAIKGGTTTGAGIGALLGLFIDVTSVWVPGLAGASLLHPLVSDDVFEPYRLEYQKQLKRGRYVMIAHGNAKEMN